MPWPADLAESAPVHPIEEKSYGTQAWSSLLQFNSPESLHPLYMTNSWSIGRRGESLPTGVPLRTPSFISSSFTHLSVPSDESPRKKAKDISRTVQVNVVLGEVWAGDRPTSSQWIHDHRLLTEHTLSSLFLSLANKATQHQADMITPLAYFTSRQQEFLLQSYYMGGVTQDPPFTHHAGPLTFAQNGMVVCLPGSDTLDGMWDHSPIQWSSCEALAALSNDFLHIATQGFYAMPYEFHVVTGAYISEPEATLPCPPGLDEACKNLASQKMSNHLGPCVSFLFVGKIYIDPPKHTRGHHTRPCLAALFRQISHIVAYARTYNYGDDTPVLHVTTHVFVDWDLAVVLLFFYLLAPADISFHFWFPEEQNIVDTQHRLSHLQGKIKDWQPDNSPFSAAALIIFLGEILKQQGDTGPSTPHGEATSDTTVYTKPRTITASSSSSSSTTLLQATVGAACATGVQGFNPLHQLSQESSHAVLHCVVFLSVVAFGWFISHLPPRQRLPAAAILCQSVAAYWCGAMLELGVAFVIVTITALSPCVVTARATCRAKMTPLRIALPHSHWWPVVLVLFLMLGEVRYPPFFLGPSFILTDLGV